MINAPPSIGIGSPSRAVHRHGLHGVGLATAHLKPIVADHALNLQTRSLNGERLQEVHTMQCLDLDHSASHFEISSAGEDDATLGNVISNEHMQPARDSRSVGTVAL